MLRTLMAILMMLGSSVALVACNTVEGAGRDVESAGEAVQDAAN